jgi:uncharacterized ferritin-like protein (DUF455 family)
MTPPLKANETPLDVCEAALAVLSTADAREKARLSQTLAQQSKAFGLRAAPRKQRMPDRPARPQTPQLKAPRDMPKRRAGGTQQNRIALLHALAHIELNAIDLAWDAAGRFGPNMPAAFSRDWIKVANDEAKHFLMLAGRLEALGSHYGALPAHDGLWQAAFDTRGDLAARLSVVPLVLEARALDVSPPTIERLRKQGDDASADILHIIYTEEIDHVRIGAHWFYKIAEDLGEDPESLFDSRLERFFSTRPKPPFNHAARRLAGIADSLYDLEKRG